MVKSPLWFDFQKKPASIESAVMPASTSNMIGVLSLFVGVLGMEASLSARLPSNAPRRGLTRRHAREIYDAEFLPSLLKEAKNMTEEAKALYPPNIKRVGNPGGDI
jgi:hypothetical protein